MHIIETRSAPNPRRVRIFLAEKGIEVEFREIDLMAGVLRTADMTALNPFQRVPILVLDDGAVITETVAICRYFEELQPAPPLFGTGALERARVEMWQRRIELVFFQAVAQAFRHLNPKMSHLEVPQVAAWGEANINHALQALDVIDAELRQARFLAGDTFSIADITLLVATDFMKPARIPRPSGLDGFDRWYRETSSRPSAAA